MPLTQADKQQIDGYMASGQPHLARAVLEGHLRQEPYDEKARKVLAKLNTLHPAMTPPAIEPAPKIKRTATNLETVAPARAAAVVPTSDDIGPIKLAIVEKRYDDAEALLILSDHPDEEKLRERLMQIRGSSGGKAKNGYPGAQQQDFTNRLVVCIVLLFLAFIPGLIALEIFAAEARKYPDAPGASGLLLTRRVVWVLTISGVVLLCSCWGISARLAHLSDMARYGWAN